MDDFNIEQIKDTKSRFEKIENILRYAISNEASDIHMTTNRESSLRIKGSLVKSDVMIKKEDLLTYLSMNCNGHFERYVSKNIFSVDTSLNFEGRRFRVHLYMSNNDTCCVMRLLSEEIPKLSNLSLPNSLGKFITATSGLVLVCGATGSGKTTTIASIINEINHLRADAILTIEDPIEYIYKEDKAVIEQREVGTNVVSFSQATVDALREDPDVIVVGEMRDLETIQNAITLAETGHLVFGTLHTKSAIDAVDRMVDIFPAGQQQQIRVQLASVLFGIVHQQLIKSNGKVVPLAEVLMVDSVIAGAIKQPGKNSASSNALRDYLRNKKDIGCVHIVDNAIWHIQNNRLRLDDLKYYLSEEDYRLLQARVK